MSSKVTIIKTLPHLSEFFGASSDLIIDSPYFSQEVFNYIESATNSSLDEITFPKVLEYIATCNFKRVEEVTEKLEYALKGDVLTFWPIGYKNPIRLEFFGDTLEKAYSIDFLYKKKIKDIKSIVLGYAPLADRNDVEGISIQEGTESGNIKDRNDDKKSILRKVIYTVSPITGLHNVEHINTDFVLPQLFYSNNELFDREIEKYRKNGYQVVINSESYEDEHVSGAKNFDIPDASNYWIKSFFENVSNKLPAAGFESKWFKFIYFTDREIFGTIFLTRPERTKKFNGNIQKLLRQFEGNIEIGDYVVHEDYGIALYNGLKQEKVGDLEMEYLFLQYDAGDELLVPISQIEKITKYIGQEGMAPRLSRMGKRSWQEVKAKIKKSTGLLARELVEHFAKRELSKAVPIPNTDSKDYQDFVEDFKFTETEDQTRSANEIIADLEKDIPMNRVLVGDVGFGKTEVMMRACFKVVESGGQVAVLAPTTVLTAQHFEVFTERFKNFPIKIGFLSRFNSTQQNNKVIDELNEGRIDIVVGTHRILSSDVKFKNLQLVVVDEEQKFGVKQKEKIKQLNYGVHVLSVSATPIPRTLGMALSSIQDISIISTPPYQRKAVKTELVKDHAINKITESIMSEIGRGGQVFIIHNEVRTIQSLFKKFSDLLPGVKFTFAHGQMSPNELDRIMTEFYHHKHDVLIATTIIENGLDLPNVNTIIVNQAQNFGLAQLYQLRGRVGRSTRQGYCYLIYKGRDLNMNAQESWGDHLEDEKETKKKNKKKTYEARLESLIENQDLGAGFRIASRDLEIRGAGNILGEQQSGHIASIGYALYMEILAEEVDRIKDTKEIDPK
jgi:transcription-repair coupling factor